MNRVVAIRTRSPWVDVHAHPGRCFLAGLGGDTCEDALAAAATAGMAAVSVATVADLAVLRIAPDGSIDVARDFAPGEASQDHQRQLDAIVRLTASTGLPVARTAADVEQAHAQGSTALLLTCEGADFAEDDLGRLELAHAAGVRSVTLVHYRPNGFGDVQTAPAVHHGLPSAGVEAVAEMNRLGILIDLAHATHETTLGVLEASSQPVMISHTHLAHRADSHPRLVTPDHARAVAEVGGLIGAWPAGITSTTFEDFVEEIVRLVDAVGLDHVAIGTDMDANYRPVLTGYDQFVELESALDARGLTAAEADAVLGGNALALLRTVCG